MPETPIAGWGPAPETEPFVAWRTELTVSRRKDSSDFRWMVVTMH
jgi:hypothetical protein